MGTRTYSRRGSNGERVLTAQGRARAGLAAIDILGNPVAGQTPAAPTSGAPWLTKPVTVTEQDRVNLLQRIPDYATAEYKESLMRALELQKAYQQNPTLDALRDMLIATGDYEAQFTRQRRVNPDRLREMQQIQAELGLEPQMPPTRYERTDLDSFGLASMRYMSEDYFANHGNDYAVMTSDMQQAVRELGNGDAQRGIARMSELTKETRDAMTAIAEEKKKSSELERRMSQMAQTRVTPGLSGDASKRELRNAAEGIVRAITDMANYRARGNTEGAAAIERNLIASMSKGWIDARRRGDGGRMIRGARTPIIKLNPEFAREFIREQVNKVESTRKNSPFRPFESRPKPGQTLGQYAVEMGQGIASRTRGEAQIASSYNSVLKSVLDRWSST